MRLRSFATASIPLFLVVAACGSSASPDSSPDAGASAPTEAKSDVPRQAASELSPAALAAAVAANNAFAVDLYAHVRADPLTAPGNLLTSPLSASIALTMTYAGAKEQTATQMATALHLGSGAPTIFEGQNALTQALDGRAAAALAGDEAKAKAYNDVPPSPGDYQLQVVNSVWGDRSMPWEPPFLDVLAKNYGTGVELVDFIHDFETARGTINDWVSAKTGDKINDLLPKGSLDDLTRMVLVNAIHLKLAWASPFEVYQTVKATFTATGGKTVSTPFMNQIGSYPYMDDGKAQILGMPLTGGQLAVIIALPHGDLATYEAGLTADSAALAPPSTWGRVALSLPKVAFTSPTFSLRSSLKKMGMKDAFSSAAANLQGLCATPPGEMNLYVSDVLQKTMVAMQETGVEAAAATAVIVSGSSSSGGPPPPVPMVVDHPFLLSIVDVPTGAVLFLGHIEDPSAAGGP